MDARLGGLKDGLLEADEQDCPHTADGGPWTELDGNSVVGFRIRELAENRLRRYGGEEIYRFDVAFSDDEQKEWLVVEHYKDAQRRTARRFPAASAGRPSIMDRAEGETNCARGRSVGRVHRSTCHCGALHDEGKKAERWQRAFGARRDAKRYGLAGPLAKTRGPIDQAILDGYRHEFGSLSYVEKDREFLALPEDWRDLVLHLVAAHHGGARPVISTQGCEDAPPSALEARARDVALRFARLQKRWGPWGLAWWETLLRAADQQASRDNDMREGFGAPHTEER